MLIRGLAFVALAGACLSAGASDADERSPIQFTRGAIDATLEGAVVRGDRDIYPINASAGQTMTVTVSGLEDNVAFQIYPPGTHYSQDELDIWTFHARPVRGTEADTTAWSRRLASAGQYLIVVGSTRGNATYSLNVRIE